MSDGGPAFPWLLAARMLREYAERLDNDSCNDYAIPDTPENHIWLATVVEDCAMSFRGGTILCPNNLVACCLAEELEALAEQQKGGA